MGIMRFFKSEGSELKALREVVETNQADEAWLDQMMTTANDIDASFDNARSAMANEPSDGNMARYCVANSERERARSLRQCHGLAHGQIVQRKIERTTAPLIEALKVYVESVEGQVQAAMARDQELSAAIGCASEPSSAVVQLKAEIGSAQAAIVALGEPVSTTQSGAATRLGQQGFWCKQLLGE